MASIRKHGGKWRAEVYHAGTRRSKVLPTRREAQLWAARQEQLLRSGETEAARTRLGDVLARYAREVSPAKRGHRWEAIRLEKWARDPIARLAIGDVTPEHLAAWRDRRLAEVSAGTVRRELALWSAVFTVARREWRMIGVNPVADVRKPPEPPHRDRLPTDDEMARLAEAAGDDLRRATARAFHAFRFALETAMRAGEICALRWDDVDLDARVARVRMSKTGRPRDVPLSREAVAILEALPRMEPVFGLAPRSLDTLWRRVRTAARVTGLTFHDSRHAAITRLARRLDVLDLARMTGHTNLNQLRTYYNAPASEIAKRLG